MLRGQFMVEFRLLGTVNLTSAEGREARGLISQPRRTALLAYLAAATPRGLHRRDPPLPLFSPQPNQAHAPAAPPPPPHRPRGDLGGPGAGRRGGEEDGLR